MTKADELLCLRVEAAASCRFAWVILELQPDEDPVEIAASLETFDKPSEAMRAGGWILAHS